MEATSGFTFRENRDEKWNEYARAGTATYSIEHTDVAGIGGKGKVTVCSAEPFSGQHTKDMVCSPWGKPRGTGVLKEKSKSFSHLFDYRRVFCGKEKTDWTVLREMNLTTRQFLGSRVLRNKPLLVESRSLCLQG